MKQLQTQIQIDHLGWWVASCHMAFELVDCILSKSFWTLNGHRLWSHYKRLSYCLQKDKEIGGKLITIAGSTRIMTVLVDKQHPHQGVDDDDEEGESHLERGS